MPRMLQSEEAARRLGVKLGTLYAYVSRGQLHAHRSSDGRRSLFDLGEVEDLARRARSGKRVETRLATVTTSITQLRADGPHYRGLPAVELSSSSCFEDVAELLWRSERPAAVPWEPAALPPSPALAPSDLLRWALLMAGTGDELRADSRPVAVLGAARRSIAAMASALGRDGPPCTRQPASIAATLTSALCPVPSEELVAAIDAMLVLLADNELATSTVAVRVAASTRADVYDALLAGLATLAGPLHGGASDLACELLRGVEREGLGTANEIMRWRRQLPGFTQTVYEGSDPRYAVLRVFFDRLATPAQRDVLDQLVRLAENRSLAPPNVDLGIASILYATGMPSDAGRTLFAVARTAGWTAHYLEELDEEPLRFRPRAIYSSGFSPG